DGPRGRLRRLGRAGARRAPQRRRRARRGSRRRREGDPMTCPAGLDRIDLTGLEAFGHHGVLDHEKRDGQTFVVDVSLVMDLAPAGRSDDLEQTVNYAEVAKAVHAIVTGVWVDLSETVVERSEDACLAIALVQRCRVTVHRGHALIPSGF